MKKTAAFALLVILLIILIAAALVVGSVKIPLEEIISIARGGGDHNLPQGAAWRKVPRIIQAAVTGMGLSGKRRLFAGAFEETPWRTPTYWAYPPGQPSARSGFDCTGIGNAGYPGHGLCRSLATIYLVVSLSKSWARHRRGTLLLSGDSGKHLFVNILSFVMLQKPPEAVRYSILDDG